MIILLAAKFHIAHSFDAGWGQADHPTTSHPNENTYDARWAAVDLPTGNPLEIHTILEEVSPFTEPLHANF